MDLLQREGHYPVPPQAPRTLGVEFSGVVEGLGNGEEKEGFKVGDEVFGLAYGGQSARFLSLSLSLSLILYTVSIEILLKAENVMIYRSICGIYLCIYQHALA